MFSAILLLSTMLGHRPTSQLHLAFRAVVVVIRRRNYNKATTKLFLISTIYFCSIGECFFRILDNVAWLACILYYGCLQLKMKSNTQYVFELYKRRPSRNMAEFLRPAGSSEDVCLAGVPIPCTSSFKYFASTIEQPENVEQMSITE